MVLHLDVNKLRQLSRIILQDVASLLFPQISQQVLHKLPGQIIQQVGVGIVGDIVKVDQLPRQVIFQAILTLNAAQSA